MFYIYWVDVTVGACTISPMIAGITLASLLSTCDFHLKMNTIQNKQNVAKGQQRGVDIKQEDVLQTVIRKPLL
jgi:outer membrane lipopolysaccharide assembly protein LptE/RlpB